MILIAALLAAYATLLGTLGRRMLSRVTDRGGDPLFGAVAWLVACVSVLAAWLGAGLLAAGWHLPAFTSVVVEACLTSTDWPHDHVHLTVPGLALPALAVFAVRAGWVICRGYAAELHLRSRHVQALRLVGRADARLGAVVLDAPEPAVYCVAGPQPTIVVTTRALSALTPAALAAVLAHERCHLTERHYLLIRACHVLARAFPFVPLFREARSRMGGLLEMRADDVAARRHGVAPLIDALTAVAAGPPLRTALGAGGAPARTRVDRLLSGAGSRTRARWRLSLLAATLAAGPVVILLVPFCS
jgi:Zn-dependent protease with chaperone function